MYLGPVIVILIFLFLTSLPADALILGELKESGSFVLLESIVF